MGDAEAALRLRAIELSARLAGASDRQGPATGEEGRAELRGEREEVVDVELVDERGNVTDAQLVTGIGGKSGMNEAAVASVKLRKYRPATKDGVPVKVWYPVRVLFVLQR